MSVETPTAPTTVEQPRVYTARDYKATVEQLDKQIAALDSERNLLQRDVDFPHIAQGNINRLEPRLAELQQQIEAVQVELQDNYSRLDPARMATRFDALYRKLDALREDRELYHGEYLRLQAEAEAANVQQAAAKIESAQDKLAALLAMMTPEDIAAAFAKVGKS